MVLVVDKGQSGGGWCKGMAKDNLKSRGRKWEIGCVLIQMEEEVGEGEVNNLPSLKFN